MYIYNLYILPCIKVHINKYSSKSYFSDFIIRNIIHILINSEHIYLNIPFPIFLLNIQNLCRDFHQQHYLLNYYFVIIRGIEVSM